MKLADLKKKISLSASNNQALLDIKTPTASAIYLESIETIKYNLYNTKLIIGIVNEAGNYETRTILYNRTNIVDVVPAKVVFSETLSEAVFKLNKNYSLNVRDADIEVSEGLIKVKADCLDYYGDLITKMPWTVKYTVISTGEIIKVDTGSIVTKEAIDPEIDWDDEDAVTAHFLKTADRDNLVVNLNAESIEETAFLNWTNLTKVSINATFTKSRVFTNSGKIEDVTFGSNCRTIDGFVLTYLTLKNLILNEGLETLDTYAFVGSSFIGGGLIIPDSVTSYKSPNNTDGKTPSGLTALSGIIKLVIGGGVELITSTEWSSMLSTVKHLEFKFGVKKILGYWSAGNTCETLILPQGLEYIGDEENEYIFGDFNLIKTLLIPGTVKYIANMSFQTMASLEELTIEKGVGYIGRSVFQNFGSKWDNKPHPLKVFNFFGGEIIDQFCFQNWYLAKEDFKITIPDTVKKIHQCSFQNHANTKQLIFAEGCEAVVEKDAFLNWFLATDLYISNSIQEIKASFNNWYRGVNLFIGAGIKQLGIEGGWMGADGEFLNWGSDYARNVTLGEGTKKVIIPDSVETIYEIFGGVSVVDTIIVSKGLKFCGVIGSGSYNSDGRPAQSNLFLRNSLPPEPIEDGSVRFFGGGSPGQIVYVPSLITYHELLGQNFALFVPPENPFAPHIAKPIDLIAIEDWDIQYLNMSTGEVITVKSPTPGSVPDEFLSSNDDYIDDIVINDTITHIGAAAFAGNFSVKRIYFFGDSVKSIGPSAFAGSSGYLRELNLPTGLERLGEYIVAPIQSLKTLTYGDKLISIGGQPGNAVIDFPDPIKPPKPVYLRTENNVLYGAAMAGDTILVSVERGGIKTEYTPVLGGSQFTINFSSFTSPVTLQTGDSVYIQVQDIVKNLSDIVKVNY